MSAGMMPALDLPGEMMPGQFGPMIRVLFPWAHACAHTEALSCTGMPSVMTTARPISASIASMTASLANFGGTNTTLTSAPVSFIASATVPKTVRSLPPLSRPPMVTVVPALRAFTPPTMFVPAAIIFVACLVPSPPVMPWTMTLLSSLRKIDMLRPPWCSTARRARRPSMPRCPWCPPG